MPTDPEFYPELEEEQESPFVGDDRPNSGLREGDISHAEVNGALRRHQKTVIFGQQNRLRDGRLMEDEKLPRFHAGHELVKFFYGAVRQLPEYLVEALLGWGISITMVKGDELLVFHHAREHQAFHAGRTRKTIYMPELVIREAYDKGYDYWAISEVIIQEAWSLLDYLLILELIRRSQQRLLERFTLGHAFLRRTVEQLNKHLNLNEGDEENEFELFFGRYSDSFYGMNREIIGQDPYEIADGIFDEELERKWASNKLYEITEAFQYPTYYNIDRDIVHPAAFKQAERRGLPVEPETVDDILHDLKDVARFGVSAQIKSDKLLDMLIDMGEPGIRGYVSLGWTEGRYYGGGYYPTVEFKKRLQRLSGSPPEGVSGSIVQDFNYLLDPKDMREVHGYYLAMQEGEAVPFRRARHLLLRVMTIAVSSEADRFQLGFEIEGMLHYAQDDGPLLKGLADIFYDLYLKVDRRNPDWERYFMGRILVKMDKHPRYSEEILEQYYRVTGGEEVRGPEDRRELIERLRGFIPENPLRQSFDPQRLRARLQIFENQWADNPNSEGLLRLLVGVLIRLDRCEDYEEIVGELEKVDGEVVRPVCAEIVEQIAEKDQQRQTIRKTALRLLQGDGKAVREDTVEPEKGGEQQSLMASLYSLKDREEPGPRDQTMWEYVRDEKWTREQVVRALKRSDVEIPETHRAIIGLLFGGWYE